MTVGELVQILQGMPQDLPVVINAGQGSIGYEELNEPNLLELPNFHCIDWKDKDPREQTSCVALDM